MSWNVRVPRVHLPRGPLAPNTGLSWRGWIASVVLHAALVVALGLLWPLVPKGQSGAEELVFEGQVALKHVDPEGETYYENPAEQSAAQEQPSPESEALPQDLLSEAQMPQVENPLPNLDVLAPGSGTATSGGGASGLVSGTPPSRRAPAGTTKTKTSFFGVEGEGNSFVYVLDRSASMGSAGGVPLRAAKAQLKASLGALSEVNLFYIIFYNDVPKLFRVPSNRRGLVFANSRNKVLAMRFIDSITAEGATEHREALLKALSLQPDVIFFLTDGDDPPLRPADLAEIRRRAAAFGTTIHVIQFGQGPLLRSESFLTRLARENRGSFRYVDIYDLIRAQRRAASPLGAVPAGASQGEAR